MVYSSTHLNPPSYSIYLPFFIQWQHMTCFETKPDQYQVLVIINAMITVFNINNY